MLKRKGFDVIHTGDLPNKERTTDNKIRMLAKEENRNVITKDNDFSLLTGYNFNFYVMKISQCHFTHPIYFRLFRCSSPANNSPTDAVGEEHNSGIKEKVIDLLKRVCTVSMETMKVVREMEEVF